MLIPWRVDVPQEHLPFVNWLIIAVIIVVFVLQVVVLIGVEEQKMDTEITEGRVDEWEEVEEQAIDEEAIWGKMEQFVLKGWGIKGLFGYIWLHGGIIHLLGNLLFLWIFGNAVCAKIGNVVYLPLYLLVGVLAGVAHLVFQGGPAIGASGAINGIVGMYLVFFAENEITCYFVWMPFLYPVIREFNLRSYWMILLWLAFDILGAVMSEGAGGGVAYFAHLGGFAAGFCVAVLLLKTGWVTMESYEKSLLQMWQGRKTGAQDDYGLSDRRFANVPEYENLGDEPKDKGIGLATIPFEEAVEPVGPKPIPLKSEEDEKQFIRLRCSCGEGIKVPIIYAGKTGKCPCCRKLLRIPERSETAGGELRPIGREGGFIWFVCSCGEGFKVPMAYAGKMGRCPKCKNRMRIPGK